MILLSGHSLTQARKIPLESLSLRLSERESTASMTPVSMDGIGTASWLLDETDPGKGIVWRVRSIQTAFATNTPTVQLEHVVSCLKDRILFGSFEASDISGGETATAEQAIRFILSRQSDWRLGRCEYNFAAPYKFDGENLYDAIAKVTGTLDDSWWDLDTSVYPFVINVIRRPAGAACEMRPGRNLSAISRTIDTSGMYTRFYPIGADDLHIGTLFIGQNEAAYGVREKVEVDQELTTEAELISWAREKLGKHAQPVINITAEGVELAAATGESLDKLTLGRICRVPLQEFGTIIEERITQLEYSDKIHNPEKVRITMSNARTDRDILHLLADELKNGGGAGGRGARTSTKKSKEDHAWFEDTDSHVAMVARGIIGTDAHGKPNWERLSRLEVNEEGIYGEVKSVQGDIVLHAARLDMNEKAIQAEVQDRTKGDQINAGMLDIQSDRVGLLVGQKENRKVVTVASFSDLSGHAGDTARIYYVANEKKYYEWKDGRWIENVGPGNYINAGGIVSAINGDGSVTTRIKGDRILVGNNVEKTLASLDLPDWMQTTDGLIADKATVGQFQALDARIGTLETDAITTANLSAKIAALGTVNVSALKASGNVTVSGAVYGSQFYVGTAAPYKNISDGIAAVQVAGPSSNVYTLQYKRFSDSSWQDAGNFSRAVASWTMGWSSGKFTAKANPQNQSCNTTLVQGTPSWDGNVVTIPVEAIDSDNPNYQYATGRSVVANAAARYNAGYVAGWNAARAKVTRIGNSVHRPKARSGTDITTDVGTEAYATAGLNNYSAWGKAKSQYRLVTPGGTGNWQGTQGYEAVGSYKFSNTMTLEYRSTDGYYGWNTEPAIEWQ